MVLELQHKAAPLCRLCSAPHRQLLLIKQQSACGLEMVG